MITVDVAVFGLYKSQDHLARRVSDQADNKDHKDNLVLGVLLDLLDLLDHLVHLDLKANLASLVSV